MKNYKIKLTIGEFSKLCCVTVKTLRHYEQLGLLVPNEVNEWTGYRYYSVEQLQKMLSIKELKSLGFSLEEIQTIFDRNDTWPNMEEIQLKIQQCKEELELLKHRQKQLRALKSFQKKKNKMEDYFIEKLPAIVVASHRETIGSYAELGALCVNVIGPEMQRLGCKCPEPGYCYTIDHNKEYRETNIDIEYCEMVTEKGVDSDIIQFKEIPEVPMAVCKKCYGPYELLPQHYTELFAYLEEKGYKITDHPRCSYIDGIWNQEDPQKWLTIIQVPVVGLESL